MCVILVCSLSDGPRLVVQCLGRVPGASDGLPEQNFKFRTWLDPLHHRPAFRLAQGPQLTRGPDAIFQRIEIIEFVTKTGRPGGRCGGLGHSASARLGLKISSNWHICVAPCPQRASIRSRNCCNAQQIVCALRAATMGPRDAFGRTLMSVTTTNLSAIGTGDRATTARL